MRRALMQRAPVHPRVCGEQTGCRLLINIIILQAVISTNFLSVSWWLTTPRFLVQKIPVSGHQNQLAYAGFSPLWQSHTLDLWAHAKS